MKLTGSTQYRCIKRCKRCSHCQQRTSNKTNNLKIKSDEIKFSRIDNKAVITGNSEIILEDNYTLSSDQVIYDKNINEITSLFFKTSFI